MSDAMPRTLIVGDVHGCLDELHRLLDHVGVTSSDRVCFVGDLVGRGPSSAGVLACARGLDAAVVQGNHEHKLLALLEGEGATRGERAPSGRMRRIGAELSPADWVFLARLPLWIDLADKSVRIVHAGLVPGTPLERQEPRWLMNLRGIDVAGAPSDQRGTRPWAASYRGPPHVVFGHNALRHVQIHPWATGLDTGCVYGGALTAMVLLDGEPVPPAHRRHEVLVSVPARRAYCAIKR
jgi:hypothetical protein